MRPNEREDRSPVSNPESSLATAETRVKELTAKLDSLNTNPNQKKYSLRY